MGLDVTDVRGADIGFAKGLPYRADLPGFRDVGPLGTRLHGEIRFQPLEYNRARTKLDCLNLASGQPQTISPEPGATKLPGWDDLVRYACLGAAASAPLILAGTIWLIALLSAKH